MESRHSDLQSGTQRPCWAVGEGRIGVPAAYVAHNFQQPGLRPARSAQCINPGELPRHDRITLQPVPILHQSDDA